MSKVRRLLLIFITSTDGMIQEHLGVALALNVPVAICVTKIDMTPPNILEQTLNMLVKILKSPGCRYV